MISKKRTWIAYAALGLLVLGVGAASARNSMNMGGDFDLSWYTIDGGGGTSSGGDFELVMTIGQPDAGNMSGGDFELQGGFLPGSIQPVCPGDVAGVSPGVVDVSDLLAVLAAWGPCVGPCPPSCPEDIQNSDCVVNVSDLLHLLASWGACP